MSSSRASRDILRLSINGDIRVTEIHDVAYDSVSNIIISGNQDTGTTYQTETYSTTWMSLHTGDGGDVKVDDVTLSGSNESLRYTSYQYLGVFRKSTWDANNNYVDQVFPALTVTGGGANAVWQFLTPFELNTITPSNIIFGASNSIYESTDQGETIVEVGVGIGDTTSFEYGGKASGIGHDHILYAGDYSGNVYTRFSSGGSINVTAAAFPGSEVRDITIDPDDYRVAFAASPTNVYYVSNGAVSGSWTDVTGDLSTVENNIQSILYVPGDNGDMVLVGGKNGAYLMYVSTPGTWYELGTNLPNVPVWDMDYDVADDVLVIGTLGRGAWMIQDFSKLERIFIPIIMK